MDINGDGKQDLNESPLGGVTVKLYKDDGDNTFEPGAGSGKDGDPIATVPTALDGSYLFENLPEGKYWVQVDGGLPTDLEVTDAANHDHTTDPTKPADLVSLTSANQSNGTVDFGFNATSTTAMLGNKVWFDVDPNGIQDPGEIGIAEAGLYICLNDVDSCNGSNDIDTGSTNPTVTTGPDGSWLVPSLTPGDTYTVAVNTSTLPLDINNTPTNGPVRRVYTMPADGSSLLVADYGFTDNDSTQNYGTIGDRVYQDVNGDGDDENGSDPGISGVTVELLNNNDAVIATTVTDTNGKYKFTGLELDKEYKVRIKGDSDILSTMTRTQTGSTDDTYTFTPTATDPNKTDAYFGFKGSGSDLGDYVWFDVDSDGIQDPEENGISNVEVRVYLDNGSVQGSKDATDTLVRTMTTDSNGKYLFSGLEIDKNYIVEVVPPIGFTPSLAGTGTETAVNFTTTTLDVDFALKGGSYSIGDTVWYDTDGNGTVATDTSEVGIEGVTVDLYLGDKRIATTTTSDGGAYKFDNLPSGNYEVRISDRNNVLANFISTTGGISQTVNITSVNMKNINFGWKYPLPTYATNNLLSDIPLTAPVSSAIYQN
ncbi:MAG: Cna B-type domain-containing protein [Candidatus Electrothrix sp. LOE1_4_5]|nr:Cna B-type domain-containing protein [Candidatus Electrothrix gigas]